MSVSLSPRITVTRSHDDLRALAGTSAEAQRTLQVRIEPH